MRRVSMVKQLIFLIITLNFITTGNAQYLVNNGNTIVVSNGAYLVVGKDIINKTATADGAIDLDGLILLDGNFENHSPNEVFINQESNTDGIVVLRNTTSPQFIKGSNPIHFENLKLIGSTKTLEISNAGVSDVLTLNAILDLNKNNFVLYNQNPTSIEYVSKYIKSETSSVEGYGTIDWRIGSNMQLYTIPFGSGESDYPDVAVSYTSLQGGFPSQAGIKFGTYHTSDRLNSPYPTSILSLSPYDALKVVDRFWITNADSYTTVPLSSLEFKYRNQDIENGNAITESNLKAIRASDGGSSWNEVTPGGIVNPINNSMTIQNILPNDWRTNWTLTSIELDGDFWIPRAYTPNEDSRNDVFKPVFGFIPVNYQFTIYNRWGERLYTTTDYEKGWDGFYKSELVKQDVYVWVMSMIRPDGMLYKYQGNFSMIVWE